MLRFLSHSNLAPTSGAARYPTLLTRATGSSFELSKILSSSSFTVWTGSELKGCLCSG